MLLGQPCLLLFLLSLFTPLRCSQKFSALTFLKVEQDKNKECNINCLGSQQKPVCASDGRTFLSRCEFQRAKCKDPQLDIAYRGRCKEVSRCVAERKYSQAPARKVFPDLFVPECNEDGTYSQVQCHTRYCWCATPSGRPISGTAVERKTPRCPGSATEKVPQRENSGKKVKGRTIQPHYDTNCCEDGITVPVLNPPPQGDDQDLTTRYPTLWTEQVRSRQNKTNRHPASSCDQEHRSALEDAKRHRKEEIFIPECASGGLYKPIQCHPSTEYCWCVLIDTGRPIPGTSTRGPDHIIKTSEIAPHGFTIRHQLPKCDINARAQPVKHKNPYKDRLLSGCPGTKRNEFLTSVLDALSTDMVHAVSDPSSSASRMSEPNPSHTLEERVVHWYFKQLDKNSNGDIGKKEMKPFKKFLRKKSKPRKCSKRFIEYCDQNSNKSLSIQELMGCLGVTKEDAPKSNYAGSSAAKQQSSKKQG